MEYTLEYYQNNHIYFCEKKLYPNSPEYLNAISSLYICYQSYIDIISPKIINNNSTIIINSIIFINGIAAFFYHWNNNEIFKLMDAFTMIIPLWFTLSYLLFLFKFSPIFQIILSFVNILILILSTYTFFDYYFPLCFASQLLLIIPLYKYSITFIHKNNNIINIGLKGIFICSSSGAIWIISEFNCNKWMIFGHPLWHIGMSTGVSYLLRYISLIPQ